MKTTRKIKLKKMKTRKVVKKSSGKNLELTKMLDKIKKAKENGEKMVVVFTTNRSHHKAKIKEDGFGVHDLKPKFFEAYKYLLINHNINTRLINPSELAVEWYVDIK